MGVGSLPALLLDRGQQPPTHHPLPFPGREEGDATVFTKRNPVHETKEEKRGAKDIVADSDDPNRGGWRFFLWGVLAFLGVPLGGLFGLGVGGSGGGGGVR